MASQGLGEVKVSRDVILYVSLLLISHSHLVFFLLFFHFLLKIFIFGFISSETAMGEEQKKQFKPTVANTPTVEGGMTPAKTIETTLLSIEKYVCT